MSRQRLLRWSIYFLELLLVFLLQQVPGLLPTIAGVRPVLLFPVAISIAMFEGELGGMTIGIATGFLVDFAGSSTIGFHCIVLAVLCFFIGRLTMHLIHTNFLTCLLCGFVFLIIVGGLQWLFGYVFRGYSAAGQALVSHYAPKLLYTFCLLPISYFINRVFALRLAENE